MRPIFIILLGATAIAGLSVVCVLREAPAVEQHLPDRAGGQDVPTREARPETAPVEPAASAPRETNVPERDARAQRCQQDLDALLANERIHFEVLSAAIQATSRPLLDQLVEALQQCPQARIEIAGHTDGDGIAELNMDLSEARSQSVRNFLIQHGIARERLIAVGYGSTQPIADDGMEEGRMQNRRIEFKVEGIQP